VKDLTEYMVHDDVIHLLEASSPSGSVGRKRAIYFPRRARFNESILGGVLPPTSISKLNGSEVISFVTVLVGP